MGDYVLMLESGLFVIYEQISSNEVEVYPVSYSTAHRFISLDEARQAAKGVNENYDNGFKVYSVEKVISILKDYSIE